MEGREIHDEPYRYGYQGQFSEKDLTTGQQEFQLRNYDARIGRWTTADPYRGVFNTPYSGMANQPHMLSDPDGGCPCPWLTAAGTWLPEVAVTASRIGAASIVSGAARIILQDGFKTWTGKGLMINPMWTIDLPPVEISSGMSPEMKQWESNLAQVDAPSGISPPGTWESLIPIWGSGREAAAAFSAGSYWKGAAYTALAISDIFLVKSIATGIGRAVYNVGLKQGFKKYFGIGMSHEYGATVSRLKGIGVDMSGYKHHWLISQEMMSQYPTLKVLGNQTWNLTRFGSQASHMRWGHGQIYGGIGYSYWRAAYPLAATPTWFRAGATSYGGRSILD